MDKELKKEAKPILESGDIYDKSNHAKILSFLLSHTLPKDKAYSAACNLINCFGNILRVLDAPMGSLYEIPDMNDKSAMLIKAVSETTVKYIEGKYKPNRRKLTSRNLGESFLGKFLAQKEEKVMLALFNARKRPIFCDIVREDQIREFEMYSEKVLNLVYLHKPSYAIVMYSNTTDLDIISHNDVILIEQFRNLFNLAKVKFEDCIIFYDNTYLSVKESEFAIILS